MYYLDTSVLVALYLPELKSNEIESFIGTKGETAISSLSELEFYSAVSRRVRMKEVSSKDGRKIISEFLLHTKNNIYKMHSIMQKEYDLARNWIGSFETPLRSLDALHLAVAFSNKLVLITSDTSLAKSADRLSIKVVAF